MALEPLPRGTPMGTPKKDNKPPSGFDFLSGCITKLRQVLQTFTWPETTSKTHCTISSGDALTAQALVDMIAHHASHLASTQSLHARAEDVASRSDTPRGSPLSPSK